MIHKNAKISPLDPAYLKGFNAGRKQGIKNAVSFYEDRLITLEDLPGIGNVTAWKVREHFLMGKDDQEG